MAGTLSDLVTEICSGIEIYYTARQGGQYLKTSFILCDDYSELTSKLFLKRSVRRWSERRKTNRKYKDYFKILDNVGAVFRARDKSNLPRVRALQGKMKTRHKRRNDFYHSPDLLDLSVSQPQCVDAFCDLLEYGEILFGGDWRRCLLNTRNLDTMELLLKLERKAMADPSVQNRVNKVLKEWPKVKVNRWHQNKDDEGELLCEFTEDLYLRLCVVRGGEKLKQALETLLKGL